MEIRIPACEVHTFREFIADIDLTAEFNIKPLLTHEPHTMRNGDISFRVTLKPYYTAAQCRKYRGMGRGYRNGKTFPRAKNALCFHGHYAFMEMLFRAIPQARLRSVMTDRFSAHFGRFMTAANFKELAYAIGEINIGSIIQPQIFREACECEANGIE